MFNDIFASWWTFVSAYFSSAMAILGGNVQPLALAASVGTACLIAGIVLAIILRQPRALLMLPLVLVASLTPFILSFGSSLLANVGIAFAALLEIMLLLVASGVIASNARRPPIWLLAAFCLTLGVYCAIAGAVVAG